MFGYYKRKREKKRAEKQKAAAEAQQPQPDPYTQDPTSYQNEINRMYERLRADQKADRESGRDYANDIFAQETEGLSPMQRRNLQESASKQLNRDIQGYHRKLLSQQGARGVRGGAAYAQEADLARIGQETQEQFQRDISQLDTDLALKKIAAKVAIEQGEASNAIMNRQMASDMLKSYNEEKRLKYIEDQFRRYFQRV